MAVANLSTAGLDKLFLEYIKPGLHDQIKMNTIVYDRFNTRPELCVGKYAVVKVCTNGAQSVRPSNSSTFPTAKQGAYNEFHVLLKRGLYASLQFDGLAMAVGKGPGAVKELVQTEVDKIEKAISNRLNKMFWADGSGRLAQLSAAIAATTTGYVDGPWHGIDSNEYTNPGQYLADDIDVDIYSSAGVLEADEANLVSAVDGGSGSSTLTFKTAVTASNNAYLFLHDTYVTAEAAGTGVPMGLAGIISASNPYAGITALSAFQGVNRSTYAWACAQVLNEGASAAAPAVLENKKILQMVHKCQQFGKVSVIITNGPIWRSYYAKLEADKTMPNEKAYWGGTSGLAFYGGNAKAIPIIWDEDCPDQSMYFIDDDQVVIVAPDKAGLDWLPGDSGHILNRVQGKDEYAANMRWYYNMSTTRPQALGLLRYIKHLES